MPDQSESDRERGEQIEFPAAPELPEPPAIKPDLPRRKSEPAAEQNAGDYRQMGIAYMIPMSLVAPIVALTLIGAWVDRVFKASYGTLGGALLGIVVGFINMFRLVGKLNR